MAQIKALNIELLKCRCFVLEDKNHPKTIHDIRNKAI
jgi:hypothetical protein